MLKSIIVYGIIFIILFFAFFVGEPGIQPWPSDANIWLTAQTWSFFGLLIHFMLPKTIPQYKGLFPGISFLFGLIVVIWAAALGGINPLMAGLILLFSSLSFLYVFYRYLRYQYMIRKDLCKSGKAWGFSYEQVVKAHETYGLDVPKDCETDYNDSATMNEALKKKAQFWKKQEQSEDKQAKALEKIESELAEHENIRNDPSKSDAERRAASKKASQLKIKKKRMNNELKDFKKVNEANRRDYQNAKQEQAKRLKTDPEHQKLLKGSDAENKSKSEIEALKLERKKHEKIKNDKNKTEEEKALANQKMNEIDSQIKSKNTQLEQQKMNRLKEIQLKHQEASSNYEKIKNDRSKSATEKNRALIEKEKWDNVKKQNASRLKTFDQKLSGLEEKHDAKVTNISGKSNEERLKSIEKLKSEKDATKTRQEQLENERRDLLNDAETATPERKKEIQDKLAQNEIDRNVQSLKMQRINQHEKIHNINETTTNQLKEKIKSEKEDSLSKSSMFKSDSKEKIKEKMESLKKVQEQKNEAERDIQIHKENKEKTNKQLEETTVDENLARENLKQLQSVKPEERGSDHEEKIKQAQQNLKQKETEKEALQQRVKDISKEQNTAQQKLERFSKLEKDHGGEDAMSKYQSKIDKIDEKQKKKDDKREEAENIKQAKAQAKEEQKQIEKEKRETNEKQAIQTKKDELVSNEKEIKDKTKAANDRDKENEELDKQIQEHLANGDTESAERVKMLHEENKKEADELRNEVVKHEKRNKELNKDITKHENKNDKTLAEINSKKGFLGNINDQSTLKKIKETHDKANDEKQKLEEKVKENPSDEKAMQELSAAKRKQETYKKLMDTHNVDEKIAKHNEKVKKDNEKANEKAKKDNEKAKKANEKANEKAKKAKKETKSSNISESKKEPEVTLTQEERDAAALAEKQKLSQTTQEIIEKKQRTEEISERKRVEKQEHDSKVDALIKNKEDYEKFKQDLSAKESEITKQKEKLESEREKTPKDEETIKQLEENLKKLNEEQEKNEKIKAHVEKINEKSLGEKTDDKESTKESTEIKSIDLLKESQEKSSKPSTTITTKNQESDKKTKVSPGKMTPAMKEAEKLEKEKESCEQGNKDSCKTINTKCENDSSFKNKNSELCEDAFVLIKGKSGGRFFTRKNKLGDEAKKTLKRKKPILYHTHETNNNHTFQNGGEIEESKNETNYQFGGAGEEEEKDELAEQLLLEEEQAMAWEEWWSWFYNYTIYRIIGISDMIFGGIWLIIAIVVLFMGDYVIISSVNSIPEYLAKGGVGGKPITLWDFIVDQKKNILIATLVCMVIQFICFLFSIGWTVLKFIVIALIVVLVFLILWSPIIHFVMWLGKTIISGATWIFNFIISIIGGGLSGMMSFTGELSGVLFA